MDAATRRDILERIEAWLESRPEEEELPEELDPRHVDREPENGLPRADLASMAAALAAAAHEVKLVGKGFRRLRDEVEAIPAGMEIIEARITGFEETLKSQQQAELTRAREEGRQQGVLSLLALHDRLDRCAVESARTHAHLSRVARWTGSDRALGAVVRGIELVREQLQDVLSLQELERVGDVGEPFDPTTMRAVGAERATAENSAGTVLETLRVGYRQGERLIRPAEVRVAK